MFSGRGETPHRR